MRTAFDQLDDPGGSEFFRRPRRRSLSAAYYRAPTSYPRVCQAAFSMGRLDRMN